MSMSLNLLLISRVPWIPAFYSWYAIIWSTTLHEVVLRTGTGSQTKTKTPLTVKKEKEKKKKKEKAHPKCRKPEGGSVQRPDKLLTGLLGLSPENGALCDAIRTRTKYGITSVQSNLSIAYTASTSLQETCRLQNEDNPVYSSSVEKKGVVIGYTTD